MIMYHKTIIVVKKIHNVYNRWIRDIVMTIKWSIEVTV